MKYRIIERFVLEGMLKTQKFKPPYCRQGCHPPDQGAWGSIQPSLEREWGIHNFSDSLFQCKPHSEQ